MTNITDAVLAATLKELTEDGIVQRRQFDEIPPRVEYCLSDKGKSVVPILQNFADGRAHTTERTASIAFHNAKNAITFSGRSDFESRKN